jgi:hypothetical protein
MTQSEAQIDLRLTRDDHRTIATPEGIIVISSLAGIGTQIMVYDNPAHNPLATIHLDDLRQRQLDKQTWDLDGATD